MLVTLLYRLEPYMDTTEESSFLQDMLMANSLHVVIKLHERLQRFSTQKPAPIQEHAEHLAHQVMKELHALEARPEMTELMCVLSKPHVQDLLAVHDRVAQKDYEPKLPSLEADDDDDDDDDDDEDLVRIIQLMKSKEPLGATVKRDELTGALVVARAQSDGAVTFKVIPGTKDQLEPDDTEVFVRAMFDYHPEKDPAIPCKELGGRQEGLLMLTLELDSSHHGSFRRGDTQSGAERYARTLSQKEKKTEGLASPTNASSSTFSELHLLYPDRLAPANKPRQESLRRAVLQRPKALFQTSRALKLNSGNTIITIIDNFQKFPPTTIHSHDH
ncbi:MAGUK p55 subfamily member 7 [Tachysurus ichikawai]